MSSPAKTKAPAERFRSAGAGISQQGLFPRFSHTAAHHLTAAFSCTSAFTPLPSVSPKSSCALRGPQPKEPSPTSAKTPA